MATETASQIADAYNEAVDHLKTELSVLRNSKAAEIKALNERHDEVADRLKEERDEALGQERNLWKALCMAKGAAERAHSAGRMAEAFLKYRGETGPVPDYLVDELDTVSGDINAARVLAGLAVEEESGPDPA